MQATKNVPNFLYFFGEQLQTMFIWMIVLLSIVCADNGLGGGLSGNVGWCVTTGDLLKVKMFEESQVRMIFCFLRPIFLIFGLKSIYRGSLAIEPHSCCYPSFLFSSFSIVCILVCALLDSNALIDNPCDNIEPCGSPCS